MATKQPSVKIIDRASVGNSNITVKEFLDFLKTAYQVQDSVEGVLLENGLSDSVDWIKLKESELVRPRDVSCQTSDSKIKSTSDVTKKNSDDSVKSKLNEVLSEGLLDSVLPYLVPANASQRKLSQTKLTEKSSSHAVASNEKLGRRKSSDTTATTRTSLTKIDSDIEIHVCDEVRNVKKDFVCNQRLLVEQMGYFAEVTTGQRLEDMDISVHCDIGIFEWLMRWVKRESVLEEDQPKLDVHCAIPVLVSAAFLRMEPLFSECLLYCHEHMNDILKTSTSLSCLNDAVLTRLSAMYTNREVEAIKDRKDKLQSRLFCKLIQVLCETEPEALRGHYCSFAKIFRCSRCFQLVSPAVEENVPCIPPCMRLGIDGFVTNHHVRDSGWSLTEYVAQLQRNLKSWRKVYWRMWGSAHFLYCLTCHRYFPVKQLSWCRFHPDMPQFFTLDAQRAPLPVGRYPCCGERAYRFQPLDGASGCHFREHTPCTDSIKDSSILEMLEQFKALITEDPPQLLFPERLTRLVARDAGDEDGKLECKEVLWWEGLEIMPQRPKLGLLGSLAENELPEPEVPVEEKVEETEILSEDEHETSSSSSNSTSSTHGSEQGSSFNRTPLRRKRQKKRTGLLWQANLSARSNQDMQRAKEEIALKHITAVLNRKTFSSIEDPCRQPKSYNQQAVPPGGIWVRLESDWRESNSIPTPQRSRNLFTGRMRLRNPKYN